MLCFDNHTLKLVFNHYPVSLETLSNRKEPTNEKDVWTIISDLLEYLEDLLSFGLHNGDLQPKYIQFNQNKIVKVVSPLLYTDYLNAYKYRLAN